MDASKIDLNAPAFGEGAQKVEDLKETPTEAAPAVVSEEVRPEVKEEKEEVPESSEEETKVPYSRFKKFHDEAVRLRQEAEEWRQKAEQIRPSVSNQTSDELPPSWVKLYGDSDESKEAWLVQKEMNEQLKEEARQEAVRAVREAQTEESTRAKENEGMLDESLEDVSAIAGRNLTEKEQSAVLDIIDDYTPKDAEGSYLGAILAPDKAWEIYELKQKALNAPKKQERDAVAALSGSQSQGQPDLDKQERDKSFNPLDWNAWRNRLPK